MRKKKSGIGLVLGSGAARGLSHIGVLKVLEEHNVPVDYIAGTSIGAIIGGLYAFGLSAFEIEKIVEDVGTKGWVKILKPTLSHSGFMSGKSVVEFFKSIVGNVRIENLKIPFSCVATDFSSGEKVVFSKGKLIDAMRASMSIPIVFSPAIFEEKIFLDGGLTSGLPIGTIRNMGANFVIAVNVIQKPDYVAMHQDKLPKKNNSFLPLVKNWNSFVIKKINADFLQIKYDAKKKILPNLLDVTFQTTQILEYNLIKNDLLVDKPDILLEPKNRHNIGWLDFKDSEEIIENGVKTAKNSIQKIKKKLHIK